MDPPRHVPATAARRWMRLAPPLLLIGWGAVLSLLYGRVGFQPLDHSIVFDGAWRILSGQVPFRDFDTPSGITPMLLQVPFFATLGVTWFAYCLHAAAVNGIFAAVVYGLLRSLGARMLPAMVYGALSAITLYPPIGVPYMDQHAYFLSFAAVALAASASRAESRGIASLGGALASMTLVAAYLSKQNPTVFVAPIVAASLLLGPPRGRRAAVIGAAAGAIVAILLGMAIGWGWGVDLRRFHIDYHVYPIREAERRAEGDARPQQLLAAVSVIAQRLQLVTLALPVVAVAVAAAAWRAGRLREQRLALTLAATLPLVGLLAAHLTNNDPEESVGFLFPSAGLVDTAIGALAVSGRRSACRRSATLARLCLFAATLRDASFFHVHVNVTRLAVADAFAPGDGARIPEALSFLVWRIPSAYKIKADDLSRLVAFLREHPGNFWLLGDMTFLYGITGRPSVGPCLWLHPGLSMEERVKLGGYQDLDAAIVDEIQRKSIRYVILEGKGTWFEVRLRDFPRIYWPLVRSTAPRWRLGGYTVLEVPEELRHTMETHERRSLEGRKPVFLHTYARVYRTVMMSVASDEGVPVLWIPTLTGDTRESPLRFLDWCHPDAEGLCMLANGLAPLVRDSLAGGPALRTALAPSTR